MCGIAGIYAYHYAANSVDRSELVAIRDHMKSRGPDGSGLWFDASRRLGLAHRRLAIIDLSEHASQPMCSEGGTLVITFNGEIYNFRELREGLVAKGHRFHSQSDTEVLLHLYIDRGAEMVRYLRGMFAFGIWDGARQTLLLARDPYGIKPLYYCDDGWTLRFASQVKALLAGGKISREPDPAGAVGFFTFGSVPEPFTMWRSIRSVPAGSTLLVGRTGARQPQYYYSIPATYRDSERKRISDQAEVEVREALRESVRSHLVADVPVGAFLSAGIDSGALVGLMRDAGAQDIQTVTIGFEEFRGRPEDETVLATQVATNYSTRHVNRIVTRSEFEADLPCILEAMDQPSIDGVNTWFVSKAARELGLKVAISGLGGDELFGGYPSFRDIPSWVHGFAIPARIPLIGKTCRFLAGPLANAFGLNPKAAGILELGGSCAGAYLLRRGLFMPWELGEVLEEDIIRAGLRRLRPLQHVKHQIGSDCRSWFGRVASLESALYMRNQLLRDADWASMAHSLEVRLPLVDNVLLDRVSKFTTARQLDAKRLLAEAPSKPLPSGVAMREKSGFTTPIEMWLRTTSQVSEIKFVRRKSSPRATWARDWARIIGQVSHPSLVRLVA